MLVLERAHLLSRHRSLKQVLYPRRTRRTIWSAQAWQFTKCWRPCRGNNSCFPEKALESSTAPAFLFCHSEESRMERLEKARHRREGRRLSERSERIKSLTVKIKNGDVSTSLDMTTAANQRIRPAAKFFLEGDKKFFRQRRPRTVLSSRTWKGTISDGRAGRGRSRLSCAKPGLNVVRIYHAPAALVSRPMH